MITALDKVDPAVRAMKSGASDYLVKPVTPEALQHAVHRSLATRALLAENKALRAHLKLFEICQRLSATLDRDRLVPMGAGRHGGHQRRPRRRCWPRRRRTAAGSSPAPTGWSTRRRPALLEEARGHLAGHHRRRSRASSSWAAAAERSPQAFCLPLVDEAGTVGAALGLPRRGAQRRDAGERRLPVPPPGAGAAQPRPAQAGGAPRLPRRPDPPLQHPLPRRGAGSRAGQRAPLHRSSSSTSTTSRASTTSTATSPAPGCWSRSRRVLRSCVRDEDVLVRYGGDEYVTGAHRHRLGRRAQGGRAHPPRHREPPLPLPRGLAGAGHRLHRPGQLPRARQHKADLIDLADRAMYRGKRTTGTWSTSPRTTCRRPATGSPEPPAVATTPDAPDPRFEAAAAALQDGDAGAGATRWPAGGPGRRGARATTCWPPTCAGWRGPRCWTWRTRRPRWPPSTRPSGWPPTTSTPCSSGPRRSSSSAASTRRWPRRQAVAEDAGPTRPAPTSCSACWRSGAATPARPSAPSPGPGSSTRRPTRRRPRSRAATSTPRWSGPSRRIPETVRRYLVQRPDHGRGPPGRPRPARLRPAAAAHHPRALPRRALRAEALLRPLEPPPLLHRPLPAQPGAGRREPRRAGGGDRHHAGPRGRPLPRPRRGRALGARAGLSVAAPAASIEKRPRPRPPCAARAGADGRAGLR